MKALTTFLALTIFTISISFPAPRAPEPQLGGGTPSAASLESDPLSHGISQATEEIPARLQPWYADYPETTDLDGARVYASHPDQVAEARTALDLFDVAGIELPYVEIWSHDSLSGCRLDPADDSPPAGVYFQRNGVDIVFQCGVLFTLLHELAHAHDVNFLHEDERQRFLRIRKAESWRHENWPSAAGEHFADVLAWGLTGGEVRPSRTLPNDNASLDKAFSMALGFGR